MKKILEFLSWKKILIFLLVGIVLYVVVTILNNNIDNFPGAVATIVTIVSFIPVLLLIIRLVLSLYIDNNKTNDE